MSTKTTKGEFWRNYKGEKIGYGTYMNRLQKYSLSLQMAIQPGKLVLKKLGRQPKGAINTDLSYEEKIELKKVLEYKKKVDILKKESDEIAIIKNIEGDIDDYYNK